MSSQIGRFLSRREKKHERRSPSKGYIDKDGKANTPLPKPDHFGGIFTIEDDANVKTDKEEERHIQGTLERLRAYGVGTMTEANARYALRVTKSQGEGEAAFRLLMLLQETYEGIVKPFVPNTKLLGAINRESVTCYLDALLFAMFARLDSFEAMLYENFDDAPRKKLAGLLRLWVNLLRSGRLITTDVTRYVQEALSECGWVDASRLRQQDPSEAFTFITGQLELPLLTLKMDLFHTGKEDPQDDHKFVNERLLEVAILDQPSEGNSVITLEDCLEHYFNNRIEVKRHLENQRRNTLKTANGQPAYPVEKAEHVEKVDGGLHVEVAEVAPSVSGTPLVQTPATESPSTSSKGPLDRIRPGLGRKRGDSIFSQRRVEIVGIDPDEATVESEAPAEKERKMSTKTEVLMPAWQFFKLLPWYTANMPTSDAQVAAHFSRQRPVLGICLKRYSFTNAGQATRLNTFIDIPLEIAVPNFVSDEHMQEEGPLVGNFRLLLQSVVCHRGVSVNSGHYISLCRGQASNATSESNNPEDHRGSMGSDDFEDLWMRFDDLAKERVTYVDIREALRQETPYLLFYQVQPIDEDGTPIHDLPSYQEAVSRSQSEHTPLEKPMIIDLPATDNALERLSSDAVDWVPASGRNSLDVASPGPTGRNSLQSERPRSANFDDSSLTGSVSAGGAGTDPTVSVPSTPIEEKSGEEKGPGGLLNIISNTRRGSRHSKGSSASKSRPTSHHGESSNGSRFSLNMSKLTQKMSRADLVPKESKETVSPTTPVTDSDAPAGVVSSEDVDTPRQSCSAHIEDASSASRPSTSDVSEDSVTSAKTQQTVRPFGKSATAVLTKKEKAAVKREKRKGSAEDRDCVLM
ncbi:unnamed protein product [Zymoseptoria tritici ST99CH_3D1]|uniref:ubiquitinyl hydrolase 1 n=3 Tax=Zymoseptoria tritici TaxID=1047171 RepID=A0A1X7S235_ZYMT9|nr:unnamed protein product [Zymoseptoria tritici ST99CH_3D7]SMR57069.1 unnamed protein product [Zymoseptoria tritici ST99CH_1E4]SMR59936.1 unnamed protein product [Zymoseptoria tritici ST99CH_3D1]